MSSEIETLHVPFAEFLRREKIPFVTPRPDRESTIAEGHPDFTLTCGNRCLMIEFKTKDGTLKAAQKRRIAELEDAGNLVLVIRDLAAAIAVVEHWRAQIGTIIPVAGNPVTAKADEITVGGSVYRRNAPGGRYEFVRLAAPASPAPRPS